MPYMNGLEQKAMVARMINNRQVVTDKKFVMKEHTLMQRELPKTQPPDKDHE